MKHFIFGTITGFALGAMVMDYYRNIQHSLVRDDIIAAAIHLGWTCHDTSVSAIDCAILAKASINGHSQ